MRVLARFLAIVLIAVGISSACDFPAAVRAALPPINPPPPPIDPQDDPDPVDPPDDPCEPPHHQPEPASLSLLLIGGGIVGLRAFRRRPS